MAKIKITGHASGTGVLTVTAPNTSTDRTITLPDTTGTLLTADGDGSSLTGVGVDGISSSADATAITIDSSERVGIGTGSPTRKVHIVDNSNYSLSVIKSGENIHMAQFASDGTASLGIAVDDNNNLVRLNSEGSNDSLQLEVADGTVGIKIDSTGAVTKPNQPAFHAQLSNKQTDLATGTWIQIPFNVEIFDQNSDFNTSTHFFTAPVTGRYQLQIQIRYEDVSNSANYLFTSIETSNRAYYDIFDPGSEFSSQSNYHATSIVVLADMDANDTAKVETYQSAGSTSRDIDQGSSTVFSGFLVA